MSAHVPSFRPRSCRVLSLAAAAALVLALVAGLGPAPASAAAAGAAATPQFLRRPNLAGDRIVFTSEGDLWLGSIGAGTAQRITSHDGVESPAFFSPDGSKLAFTAQYDGGTDVYVMDVAGGSPVRLTYDPVAAQVLGWSADGREVLFRSRRLHGRNRNRAWAVPATGGPARLLPIPVAEFAAMHADGKRVAYVPVSSEWANWRNYRGGQADELWLADTAAKTFRRLTDDPAVDTAPCWVGDALYFASERDGHPNLWRLDPATGAATQVTRYKDVGVRYPTSDGKRVVFEHGDGVALYDPATDAVTELAFELRSDRVHTRSKRVSALAALEGVDLGPTGKRLLVSGRGQVLSAPVEHGDVSAVLARAGARCQHPAWSPDGRTVAFVSDESGEEQVWTVAAAGGTPRQLTRDHKGPIGMLVWSPDGRWIATSDREMRILLVDAASGAVTQVDQADRGGSYDVNNTSYRFSPDSRWLAYARVEPTWNQAVYLYEIATRKATALTDPGMNCGAPAFDPEGKYLYFLADRDLATRYVSTTRFFTVDATTRVSVVPLAAGTPSPFLEKNDEEGAAAGAASATAAGAGKDGKGGKDAKGTKAAAPPPAAPTRVDLAGIRERIVDVPVPTDRYLRVEPVAGRLLLLTLEEPGGNHGRWDAIRKLYAFDLDKRERTTVVERLTDFDLSADRKKLLVQKEKDFQVADASAESVAPGKGKVETGAWIVTVDPQAEWRQIFGETWRLGRDFFYDPGLHGVDWDAVRRRYEAMLPAVADRSDLTAVQKLMVGELNCGHAYVAGGDAPGATPVPMGYLGADFTPIAGPPAAYRVDKLYPGDGFDHEAVSPLLAPGVDVKPGDYILAVGGVPVRADQDLQALLVGTADRVIRLTVNRRPSFEGAREVRVRPLKGERLLRMYDWIAGRREYVRQNGGGDLGYVYIPDMQDFGMEMFLRQYYGNLDQAGIVFDTRYNTGGYIDAWLLNIIGTKPYSYFKPRYGVSWTRQDWGFPGHSVALCNANNWSDGEEFVDAFQRLKLGPVIGVTTGGAEVGSGEGWPMVDGGSVYIPNYAEWVPQVGWVIEGTGVKPDITVEDDPAAVLAGRDLQLDRAIQYLREKAKAEPVSRPQPPVFPNKAVPSGR